MNIPNKIFKKPESVVIRFVVVFVLFFSFTYVFADKKLEVVTTNSIIEDWVKEIGQGNVNVYSLAAKGVDLHTFEPSAKDLIKIQKCDVLFLFGYGLEEHWLKKFYDSSGSKSQWIALSEAVEPIMNEGEHRHSCKMCGGEKDPHTWLDVNNAILMVEKLTQVLSEVDPENAELYRSRYEAYKMKLERLEKWILEEIEEIPSNRRRMISNHDSLRYFARRYGLIIEGSVLGSNTTDQVDPSSKHIHQVIGWIKKYGIKAIFSENTHSNAVIEEIAKGAGLGKPLLLVTDGLNDKEPVIDTYIQLMEYNVKTISGGLR